MGFEITAQDSFRVIALTGEIDLETSPEARREILELLKRQHPVLVDMAGVDFIDSSGIASLLEGMQYAKGKNLAFGLVGVNKTALDVFELARLDKVFPMHSTLAEAIAAHHHSSASS